MMKWKHECDSEMNLDKNLKILENVWIHDDKIRLNSNKN